MNFNQIIDNIYPLPEASRQLLQHNMEAQQYPKGHILLSAGKIERRVYFIKQGMARAYSNIDGNDVTFWFGKEGDVLISMRSYVENKEGYEYIELLEDCVLYEMQATALQELYLQDVHIANWGRKFAEKELIKTEQRLIERLLGTATDRYAALVNNHPHLLQRVQLCHIASFLGITQVSLSRIRAEFK